MATIENTRFLAKGKKLTFVSDAVTTGQYHTVSDAGVPGTPIAIAAGASVTIESGNVGRTFKFITNGTLTYTEEFAIASGDDDLVDWTNATENFSTSGTLASGAQNVTGNIVVSGTVDGRDLATDGAKLDGVEALADVTDETNVVSALDGATLSAATVTVSDKCLIHDVDDSDALKTATVQSIVDLAVSSGNGCMDFLGSTTISSDSTIDLESFITGDYIEYRIKLINVVPATDSTRLEMVVGTGGTPTYQTGATDYDWAIQSVFADNDTIGAAAHSGSQERGADSMLITGTSTVSNTQSDGGLCVEIIMYDPSNASTPTAFVWSGFNGGALDDSDMHGFGKYNSTTAVTALRFLSSSGNLASGFVKVYGVCAS